MTDKEFDYYLQQPGDGKYYNLNSLAYYFEDMAKKEILIKELAKRIVEYDAKQNLQLTDIEKQVATEMSKWDQKTTELPETVNGLLDQWLEDGTLNHVIDSTIIDIKLSPITQEINTKADENNLLFKKNGLVAKINYPSEVKNHPLPINIYNNAGTFRTDFNPRKLKPVRSAIYYVNPAIGNDANDGLSITTPFKSISKALLIPGDNEIRLSSGIYYYQDGWKGTDPGKGVSVIATKGKAVLSNSAYPRRWVEDPAYPGVYSTPSTYNGESLFDSLTDMRFLVAGYDTHQSGGTQLQSQSVSLIQGGKTGYAVGSVNTQIRLPNNLDPNRFLDIKYARDNMICTVNDMTDSIIYLENIEVYYGKTSPLIIQNSTAASKVIMINVKSFDSRSTDGIELTCNGLAVLWGCEASNNFQDGINYYVNQPVSGSGLFYILEVECEGHNNGRDATGTNNGTTLHSTARAIRLNCNYDGNQNRNVHDVGGGWSFNVGVRSRFSQTNMEDFSTGLDSIGTSDKMWLVGCDAGIISSQRGGTLYKETGSLYDSQLGSGNITDFLPY